MAGQEQHRDYAPQSEGGPNRHNPNSSIALSSSPSPFLGFNQHNPRSPPPSLPAVSTNPTSVTHSSISPTDRDTILYRQVAASQPTSLSNSTAARSTLWWGELEPWMDEEYAKQVCNLMNWDAASIKVPHPAADPITGQQANNPGYCFLTFPSPAHAASVLAQISKGVNGGPLPMPNSAKPFVMNWASSVNASASPVSTTFPSSASSPQPQLTQQQQYPKEYSIFVGDLAPETSNSDLVAVFRNPVLGLRNDREPKFIRPFLSCKSAKIMLDPQTGVSRGYGFVRFTDEADQQRALIEMHGLYCLSRPMRISPATAKFKGPPAVPNFDMPQVSFTPPLTHGSSDSPIQPVTIAVPMPIAAKSVSAPIAATGSNMSLSSNAGSSSASGAAPSFTGSHSNNSLSSGTGSSVSLSTTAFGSDDILNANAAHNLLGSFGNPYGVIDNNALKMASISPFANEAQLRQALAQQVEDSQPRYVINEESWKHHAQARAILGNLIGPNGEQLTSTDPYNTTVFVGGLSPLISEETLRTFFAPFGDIHYVKVPVGKHCGFVQFVRKADAEKAIEKMQGFPIGGSRIRLSWGRSQYKAAQAAAQAAQTAALQAQYQPLTVQPAITQDQALQILQKFSSQGYFSTSGVNAGVSGASVSVTAPHSSQDTSELENSLLTYGSNGREDNNKKDESVSNAHNAFVARPEFHRAQSNFSPFSPDPNNIYMSSESLRRDAAPFSRLESLPHPSKAYAPGFFPVQQQQQDLRVNTGQPGSGNGKVSPTSLRQSNSGRYTFAETSDPPTPINRAPGRSELPISRPPSGQLDQHTNGQDFDRIQDLNNTLASLELDNNSWKPSDSSATATRPSS
ncbi:hypothetical protein CPC08DRAFT_634036 [Agrocybe pediades]|nr:hypothetical protein CPC08DRAFT_634036 [Agrocybe pediades]